MWKKKNVSFFRNRDNFFWGYSAFQGNLNFFDFYFKINNYLIKKAINLSFIKNPRSFFFGKKKDLGFSNSFFFKEFSETSVYRMKSNIGFNFSLRSGGKNYVNFN